MEDSPRRRGKILLIDNDKDFLEATRELLSEAGYESLTCPDIRDSLKFIRSFLPDCVLLDMRMPLMDGEDLLPVIRRQHPRLPVIACTGAVDVNERFLLEYGVSTILLKPVNPDHLFAAIDRAIAQTPHPQEEHSTVLIFNTLNLRQCREMATRTLILKALRQSNFNMEKAADLLGIKTDSLYRYLKRHHLLGQNLID